MTPGSDSTTTSQAGKPARRRVSRSLLLMATTALVVATGGGVATAAALTSPTAPAATSSDTPSATPSGAPSDKKSGKDRGHKWGFHKLPIHGEFVVPNDEGGYATFTGQQGEVTAVGQGSVTVKSADGYTKEYTVNDDTRINRRGEGIDTVKAGQKVAIMAKVEGDTATAVVIRDMSARDGKGPEGRGYEGMDREGQEDRRHGKDDRSQRDDQQDESSSPSTEGSY
ncbi:hypothetical protein [Nonomuraea cavernae]|uniref:DUF5666 domain-containing protein n=1 Tax=Nonomuraea cavernae TaxID=2045107 RepID=A0A917ZAB3_9ACTN|nr:hypothetical protein [Nonomuraea cavernae]MCA2189612.1 hypothetical protein [Nonomuraea cavernae]GGO77297.1 hypothetical protein GCM10012289_56650 [Nonomuraea cavernae]